MNDKPLKLAVLISGGGRTLQNIEAEIQAGRLNARIELVISSKGDAYGVKRSEGLGLETHVICRKDYGGHEDFSKAIWERIGTKGIDLVCCAGFLSLLAIPDAFASKVINVHPSLLPAFGGKGMYGHRVHEAVLGHGCKLSGCTVHYCDRAYDTGPIIAQASCPVFSGDTADVLAARVFELEVELYPKAIALIADGMVRVEGGIARLT